MKTTLLTLLFCLLLPSVSNSAELLVRAKPHWKDNWDSAKVNSLLKEDKQEYEARSQIGDIIVVKPDGWKWGKEECLPNYIVVKISDLKIEDAKKYEETLMDITNPERPTVLKRRKYQIPKTVVDNAKQLSQTKVSVSEQEKDTFIANIAEKTE